MTADNFSVVYSGPVTEEADGIKIATVGRRNGNRIFLKDAFNIVGADVYIKWHLASNSFIWGGFRLSQTSVTNYLNPIPDNMKNQWIYTRISVGLDYSFEVVSSTGNYDDDSQNPGAVVHTNSGTVPESERAILGNTSVNNIFWDTYDTGSYLKIGELLVPDHPTSQFYEVSNFDFEDQLVPAEIEVSTSGTIDFPQGADSNYSLHVKGNASTNDYIQFPAGEGVDLVSFDVKINHANSYRIQTLIDGINRFALSVYYMGDVSYSEEWCEVTIPVINGSIIRIEFWTDDGQDLYLDNIRQYNLNSSPSNLSLDNNSIDENSSAPTLVGTLSADDADNDALTFSLTENSATDNELFDINGGNLETVSAFDYETANQYQIEVEVSDGISNPVLETFTIAINDVNEAPVIPAGQTLSVPEESAVSTVVGSVTATDEDAGDDAPVFSIQSGNEEGFFALDAATGELTLVQAGLNRYDYESFSLLVRATDQNDAQLFSEETVLVNVDEIPFSGGAGTETDPFQIKTPKDLDEIRNYLGSTHSDKFFELINDIDLQEYLSVGNPAYNDGAFWDPIGNSFNSSFRGSLNGNNFSILNLAINRPGENYVGLFGFMYDASVSHLTIEIPDTESVEGTQYVGALSGSAEIVNINGVNVAGSIYGNLSDVGGLIGYFEGGVLENCHANVNVSAVDDHAGGIVGRNWGAVIKCISEGSVTAETYAGGLVGMNDNNVFMGYLGSVNESYSKAAVAAASGVGGGLAGYNVGDVSNSYASGSINGSVSIGGLVGSNAQALRDGFGGPETVTGTITNCYSAAIVNGSDVTIGGLAGVNDGNITSSYWDINVSGQENSAGGMGLNSIQMREAASFTGWDFTNIWAIDALSEYVSYPYLRNNEENPHPGSIGVVTINSWPVASDIVYGQSVGESVLSGGEAIHEGSPVAGTFYFSFVGDTHSVGTHDEGVVFFPDDAGAYLPVLDGTTSVVVAPKSISVVGAVAQNKSYDGTMDAVVIGAALEENAVEGSDEVILSNHSSGTFAQANAGDNIVVIANMALTGADAFNYELEQPVLSASIGKLVLTAAADDKTRVYGEANPELTISYSGFVNGEDASFLTVLPDISTLADAGSNVGNYAINVGGGSDENYNFGYEPGVLAVNQAPLTVKAADATRVVGEPNPVFELVYTGFVNSDDASSLDVVPVASCEADELSEPGNYDILVSGGSDNNYYFIYDATTGVLTVTTATSILPGLDGATSVYPVPSDNYVFIQGIAVGEISNVMVVDLSGKFVKAEYSEISDDLIRLDVTSLKSGIYFMKIQKRDEVVIEKIVVL